MSDPMIRRINNMVEAELGYEVVGLDVERGRCFGFNETAAWVWAQLEKPQRRSSLRDALVDRFEVQEAYCDDRLTVLLQDLEVKGLIACS
jgi:hypothetical protein